jgi:HAD superfamily hydrolase (TIGR01458 family)
MLDLTPFQGLLIDLDGVLYVGQQPIEGAIETVRALNERGPACRYLTNTSTATPQALADKLARLGFAVEPTHIFTAAQAAADYLGGLTGVRARLCVHPNIEPMFAATAQSTGPFSHVVIGDIGANWTYELLNSLLADLLAGAQLVAIHKNRFWQTQGGLMMDIGGFVAALEYASKQEALVMGKPSAAFFKQALHSLQLPAWQVAVIGDDIDSDVHGAQLAGLRGVLCKTGKYRAAYAQASAVRPDATLERLSDLLGQLRG